MTGLDENVAIRAMNALEEAGYLTWSQREGTSVSKVWIMPRLLEAGRRSVGQRPADSIDALVATLEQRIAAEPQPERRSRLEQLRDGIVGVGRARRCARIVGATAGRLP